MSKRIILIMACILSNELLPYKHEHFGEQGRGVRFPRDPVAVMGRAFYYATAFCGKAELPKDPKPKDLAPKHPKNCHEVWPFWAELGVGRTPKTKQNESFLAGGVLKN